MFDIQIIASKIFLSKNDADYDNLCGIRNDQGLIIKYLAEKYSQNNDFLKLLLKANSQFLESY